MKYIHVSYHQKINVFVCFKQGSNDNIKAMSGQQPSDSGVHPHHGDPVHPHYSGV